MGPIESDRRRVSLSGRLRIAVACSLAVLGPALAESSQSGQDPPTPAAGAGAVDLLRSRPFDRITLNDGSTLIVDPVSPRPLPPFDPKRRPKERGEATKIEIQVTPKDRGTAGKGGNPRAPAGVRGVEDDDPSLEIPVHLIQDADARDFRVKRYNIKTVEYFEDMLMSEADRLVAAREFARGFEHLLRVKLRNPGWRKLDEHVNRLLFAEGSAALIDGDDARGVRLLRELLSRDRAFPGLLDRLASAYAGWIGRAIELGQYAKGRSFLHDLEDMAPGHAVVRELRGRFTALASEHMRRSEAGADGPARLDELVEALRIWPDLPEAASRYRRAFETDPTLDVAVGSVAWPLGPWVHSPADARITPLLYRPILAPDRPEAPQGQVPGQLAAGLDSTDLGRRLIIRLRSGLIWSDGSREVSAADVARALIDRIDPHSPRYSARWADLLDRVEMDKEGRVEVRLNRPMLKPGYWFETLVGPAHAGQDGRIATTDSQRLLVTDGTFRGAASTESATELRRAPSSAQDLRPGQIRRLRESHRSSGGLVEAIRAGDVSLIDHVAPTEIEKLRGIPEIKIGRLARPSVHVIAIDGRNPALRNRSLRRALSLAINRRSILEDAILMRAPDAENTTADGPFAKGSYADAGGVKPLETNAVLSSMLVAAARREQNQGPISLKLEYPSLPEPRAAVPRIAEAFRKSGVQIEAIERDEARLEGELRTGRRFDLAYRVLRCDEPMLEAGICLFPAYDASSDVDALASAPSPRILQLLLQLERAGEVPSARALAVQIDRESRDELPVLPLWQLVDHYAWRTRLTGPAEVANHLYEGLETWEIAPWIAKDPWTKTR